MAQILNVYIEILDYIFVSIIRMHVTLQVQMQYNVVKK